MSAADRMVVRTRDGSYRSFPRRTALGMISRGQATAAAAPQTAAPSEVDPLGPHGDEYQAQPEPVVVTGTHEEIATKMDALAPLMTVGVEITSTLETAELLGARDIRMALPTEPRGNASRQEWADYASDLGVIVTDGMTRNNIRDAAQDAAQSLARLPQPALPGGRLETPEDEPAAERLADDEDPGTE